MRRRCAFAMMVPPVSQVDHVEGQLQASGPLFAVTLPARSRSISQCNGWVRLMYVAVQKSASRLRYLEPMKDFIKHSSRGRDGSWTCIVHAEIRHTTGRIQVAEGARFTLGTIFMAVDIVKLLEQEFHRLNGATRPISHLLDGIRAAPS